MAHKQLVISEMIESLEYQFEDSLLAVTFKKGQIYIYENVPTSLYQLLLDIAATNEPSYKEPRISLGTSFHLLIKIHPQTYPFTKLEDFPVKEDVT